MSVPRAKSLQLCPTLYDLTDLAACQAPLFVGFSKREYWSALPCPPPGNLPNPGIEPKSLACPALAGGFFSISTTWEAQLYAGEGQLESFVAFAQFFYKSKLFLKKKSILVKRKASGNNAIARATNEVKRSKEYGS